MRWRFAGLLLVSALAAGLVAHFSPAEPQIDVICSSSFTAPVLKQENTVGSHRYVPGLPLLKAALPQGPALLFTARRCACTALCSVSVFSSGSRTVPELYLAASRARAPPAG